MSNKVGEWLFLNDVLLGADQALISPFDRGFLFGDAAYEMMAIIGACPLHAEPHLLRLQRSLRELEFGTIPEMTRLLEIVNTLIQRNAVSEGRVYIQVSRGTDGCRRWIAGERTVPTVFAYVEHDTDMLATKAMQHGIRAITLPEQRWKRRDIKSNNLLAQCLAYRRLAESGAGDAFMVEDGVITEAIAANVWIIGQDQIVRTRQLSSDILAGITRKMIIECLAPGFELVESAFTPKEAFAAAEIFVSSASRFIVPVTELDGKRIGSGQPGLMTRRIQAAYFSTHGVGLPDWL